jgi:protease-4
VGKVSDGNDVNWERKVLEKLALEALAEQKRGRRWGIFFKLLGFGYLALLLVVALDLGKGEHVADGAKLRHWLTSAASSRPRVTPMPSM